MSAIMEVLAVVTATPLRDNTTKSKSNKPRTRANALRDAEGDNSVNGYPVPAEAHKDESFTPKTVAIVEL